MCWVKKTLIFFQYISDAIAVTSRKKSTAVNAAAVVVAAAAVASATADAVAALLQDLGDNFGLSFFAGSQAGIKLFDWDGSTQIYEYDFNENGIGVDERLVAGGMARGIAAVGPNFVAVGIHTGTVVVFEVTSDADGFVCRVADSQRRHAHPVTDLASTAVPSSTDSSTAKDARRRFFLGQ